MGSINKYLKYYIDAHRIENKLISISDLKRGNLDLSFFFYSMNIVNRKDNTVIDVPKSKKDKWAKELQLYQSRKQLVGTALAYKNTSGKIIPVLIFPCQLLKFPDGYRLFPDFEGRHINPTFRKEMKEVLNAEQLALLAETLEGMDGLREADMLWIYAFVENHLPNATVQKGFSKLELAKPDSFRYISKNSFLNQISVGIVSRSNSTASLLSDFETLILGHSFSKPIRVLFNNNSIRASRSKLRLFNGLPLSQAQKDICASSVQEYLKIVIGPPGTGKSYTMSALAVQLVENGYSVLISSKTNQAVDIVFKMLLDEWGAKNYALRLGRGKYRKEFKTSIHSIGQSAKSLDNPENLYSDLKNANRDLEKLNNYIQDQIDSELGLSLYLRGMSSNVFMDLWAKYKLYRKQKSESTISVLQSQLDVCKKVLLNLELERLVSRHLSMLKEKYKRVINLTDTFLGSISSRDLNWRKRIKRTFDYKEFFNFYPLWLCKANEVGQFFPQKQEMFDFVLIDEASQMDIATSFPLLQRGKHIICVGDHQQLRHISFLSKKKEEELASSNFVKPPNDLISYRNNSILDMIEDRLSGEPNINLLDEHYRSLPSLIHFSNHYYYNNCLKVMRSLSSSKKAIKFHRVDGSRSIKGVNKLEASHFADMVRMQIHSGAKSKIGIISPFRKQVDLISELCMSSFTLEEMNEVALRVDTPYGFQGDEREVIYISMVLDSNSKAQSIHYLQSPGLWNVCITRARKEQHIVHSFDKEVLPQNNIARQYFEFQHEPVKVHSDYSDFFVSEIKSYLETIGVKDIIVNRDLGALQLDLSFFFKKKAFVIDLVGYPGEQEGGLSIEDQALLHRMGIRLVVVLYSDWVKRKNQVQSDVRAALNEAVN